MIDRAKTYSLIHNGKTYFLSGCWYENTSVAPSCANWQIASPKMQVTLTIALQKKLEEDRAKS